LPVDFLQKLFDRDAMAGGVALICHPDAYGGAERPICRFSKNIHHMRAIFAQSFGLGC
jgi:hypothetical protein